MVNIYTHQIVRRTTNSESLLNALLVQGVNTESHARPPDTMYDLLAYSRSVQREGQPAGRIILFAWGGSVRCGRTYRGDRRCYFAAASSSGAANSGLAGLSLLRTRSQS